MTGNPPKLDLLKIAVREPQSVAITYLGKCYRYYPCSQCGDWFWKATDDQHLRASRVYQIYCSQECRDEGYRALNNARQKRYRIAYDAKHGEGAWYRKYQRSRR